MKPTKVRNPIDSYNNHLAFDFPSGHRGAIHAASAYADLDFEHILRQGERLIVTATMGRGVKLSD